VDRQESRINQRLASMAKNHIGEQWPDAQIPAHCRFRSGKYPTLGYTPHTGSAGGLMASASPVIAAAALPSGD